MNRDALRVGCIANRDRLRACPPASPWHCHGTSKRILVNTTTTFADLGLAPVILKSLAEKGYEHPTPVQAQAIPAALAGTDLLVSSQTGSGKTAAFMLPCLTRLEKPATQRGIGPRVLVLAPTRELALQVQQAASTYGRDMRRLRCVTIVGGASYTAQLRMLARPVDVVVATPGRLIDHLERSRIDLSRVETLILDEADRMLDMGFIDDVERIVAATPATRQTLLFSATMEGDIARLAQRILKNPARIAIASQAARHENIEQRLHFVDDLSHKNKLLRHLLGEESVNQAIVFTATKLAADQLAAELQQDGHAVAALHGDMKQGQRNRTLQGLRRGDVQVLVATDVAARGIDVSGISHVINFDLPKVPEDYVHRIGRTGRAGASGVALSLVSHRDNHLLQRIQRFANIRIPVHVVEGLEPKVKSFPSDRKPSGKKWSGPRKPGFGAPSQKRSFSNDSRKPAGDVRKPSFAGANSGQGGGWKKAANF
ncbi:MAG: DEAD/DEAH box helicase [Rhodocyclaceae bacterium]|nr:DEAD/DEAH box helicase [Rhodocyclaceae bacterium]